MPASGESTQTMVPPPGSTIAESLKIAPLAALENRILLMHALSLSRVQLITQSDRVLSAKEAQHFSELVQRRLSGEPIAYITGEREFYGLSFAVTPDVLIPRHETELLVELALQHLPNNGRVLDMGTGSGAIAVAIAHMRPDTLASAVDISPAALVVARGNAARHKTAINFLQSDWYHALQDQRFNLIIANPPYIVAGDVHLSQGDLRFEPIAALTDAADGLSALHTIIEGAPRHLMSGSWLLMEHGYDQAQVVRGLLNARGFSDVTSWKDLAGIERVSGGRYVSRHK